MSPALNQLTKVTGADGTYHEYVYDDNGNIVQVKQNGSVVRTYTYGNGMWKDQLTAVGTQSISYDEAGNPLSYMDATMRWTNGRLPSYVSRNGHAVSYTYASDGTRATKTADDITTTYHYVGGRLYGEKSYGESVGYSTRVYLYDDTDSPYGYIYNGTTYYYEKNMQGDVVGIWHQNGTKIVNYTYDVWGKLVSMTDQYGNSVINEERHQGNLNPIRYRGYYYDTELELYWLSTRFYDPEIGRFVNADAQVSNGLLSNNQYAYCVNNPIRYLDDTGEFPVHIIVGGIIGALSSGVGTALAGLSIGKGIDLGDVLISVGMGLVTGALTAAFPGSAVLINSVGSTAESLLCDWSNHKSLDTALTNATISGAFGAVSGSWSGPMKADVLEDGVSAVRKLSQKGVGKTTKASAEHAVKQAGSYVGKLTVESVAESAAMCVTSTWVKEIMKRKKEIHLEMRGMA